jgi:hypothetical protein
MAIEDSITEFTNSLIVVEGSELSSAEGWVTLFITLALIGVGIFIAARYIITLNERPEGIYAGEYLLQIANLNEGGANEVTCHLSKSRNQFSPKMAHDLMRIIRAERQMDMSALDEFKKLLGKCIIFNANISDFKKDNIIKGNKKAIIISNVDLSQEEFYREEGEGSFTITSGTLHKYTRNVQCVSAQVVDIGSPTGELIDVYMINALSTNLKAQNPLVLSNSQFALDVHIFPEELNVEVLGRLSMFLPTLVELYNKVQPSEDEIGRLQDKNQQLLQQKGEILRELEIAKDRAIRKPILGHDRPFSQSPKGVAWGWQIITGVMGALGFYLPSASDSLEDIPEWFLVVLLVGFAVLLRWTVERKKDPLEKANEVNESEKA